MALEIEHKYLVISNDYKKKAKKCIPIRQGYLSRDPERTVRVRTKGEHAYLTVKTKNKGIVRNEFEYEIPLNDALQILDTCLRPIILKNRYLIDFEGFTWEVDEFLEDLSGITVAEIELPTPETPYSIPPFIGKEVTGIPKYYNSNIYMLAHRK